MDPKLNTLDPKLQETYAKVMGTPTTPIQPASPSVNPLQATTMPQATGGIMPISTDTTQTAMPPPAAYTPDNLSFQAAIQAPAAATAPIGAPVGQPTNQGTSSTLKILYIVAAVVFFIIYTFVWIKIFNIPLPF